MAGLRDLYVRHASCPSIVINAPEDEQQVTKVDIPPPSGSHEIRTLKHPRRWTAVSRASSCASSTGVEPDANVESTTSQASFTETETETESDSTIDSPALREKFTSLYDYLTPDFAHCNIGSNTTLSAEHAQAQQDKHKPGPLFNINRDQEAARKVLRNITHLRDSNTDPQLEDTLNKHYLAAHYRMAKANRQYDAYVTELSESSMPEQHSTHQKGSSSTSSPATVIHKITTFPLEGESHSAPAQAQAEQVASSNSSSSSRAEQLGARASTPSLPPEDREKLRTWAAELRDLENERKYLLYDSTGGR